MKYQPSAASKALPQISSTDVWNTSHLFTMYCVKSFPQIFSTDVWKNHTHLPWTASKAFLKFSSREVWKTLHGFIMTCIQLFGWFFSREVWKTSNTFTTDAVRGNGYSPWIQARRAWIRSTSYLKVRSVISWKINPGYFKPFGLVGTA